MTTYKYKNINTSVDKDKTTVEDNGSVFYTEDKGTTALRLFITWKGQPFNLDNTTMKPALDLFHSDGSIWRNETLEVVSLESGLVQYKIPNNVITHAGNVRAKLFLKNDNESVHVANFDFTIKDSGIEGTVEKEISVNLVEDTVRRIIKENAIELLGDGFEDRLNTDVINHLESKPELFKGTKGDSLKYADLSTTEKEELKNVLAGKALDDYVINDKSILNAKLGDNFATVRILSSGEDLKLVNREGNYFKNTADTLTDLPSELGNGAGKSFIITVNSFSQWHYVQTIYDLNNDATIYVRTIKNQISSKWHAQSDDSKIIGMANDQANVKMQYNLNVFEKYNNEVVPDKTLKYYTAIQDIKITGIDNNKPVKIWVLSRNYNTWGYRIIIGQKVDGVWKSIIDTANGGLNVTEATNGITEIEYTRNDITLKARIDYNVIQNNDRLLDHNTMADEPYFIIRPSKSGSGGGTAYNQSLNTTDNVRFASVKADAIEVGGELKKGTLQTPPTGLVKGDMWLDTTDSTIHPILRVMS